MGRAGGGGGDEPRASGPGSPGRRPHSSWGLCCLVFRLEWGWRRRFAGDPHDCGREASFCTARASPRGCRPRGAGLAQHVVSESRAPREGAARLLHPNLGRTVTPLLQTCVGTDEPRCRMGGDRPPCATRRRGHGLPTLRVSKLRLRLIGRQPELMQPVRRRQAGVLGPLGSLG